MEMKLDLGMGITWFFWSFTGQYLFGSGMLTVLIENDQVQLKTFKEAK